MSVSITTTTLITTLTSALLLLWVTTPPSVAREAPAATTTATIAGVEIWLVPPNEPQVSGRGLPARMLAQQDDIG